MAIFKKPYYYDNSIMYIDTEWSADADPEINVRFAHGRFNMDYYCPRSAFVNDFKEDFTAFYEKVMKDYDEVTGRSNVFEGCFDAMLDDMTEIDYRPELKPKSEEVKDTEKRIRYLEAMLCKELYKYGMSISDISKRLSIAESTVKYFVDGGE